MSRCFLPTHIDEELASRLPYRKRSLLTKAEKRFFQTLAQVAAGRWGISLKTRLADLIRCDTESVQSPHFRKLSQKHIDFVLYHPGSGRVIAAIELDDSSHESEKRRARDLFVDTALSCAGIRVIRVRASASYNPFVIACYLKLAVKSRRSARG